MKLARIGWLAITLLAACSGKSNEVCPSEKHRADPDGHGARCVDDRSTCDAPSDCVSANECCTAACADPGGDGVYECAESCRSPECTAGSCAAGWLCQEVPGDACTAYCVPDDLHCPDGTIGADPTGSGTYVCVPIASTCLRPSDCPGSADGCCTGSCAAQADGTYACEQDCGAMDFGGGGGDADADADGEAMWECTTDPDCENMMGAGWTCAQYVCGGNECVPPAPECDGDEDCVLAIDTLECCMTCAAAYSVAEAAANECLLVMDSSSRDEPGAPAPPEDPAICGNNCADVACPAIDCMPPTRATCSVGQCVPIWE